MSEAGDKVPASDDGKRRLCEEFAWLPDPERLRSELQRPPKPAGSASDEAGVSPRSTRCHIPDGSDV
jgi:hypothetical protein